MNKQIKEARDYAVIQHARQTYGIHNYEFHLDEVYQLVCEAGLNDNFKIAAYLHDILEDTQTTKEELRDKFNSEVAEMVYAVSGFGENRKSRTENIMQKLLDKTEYVDLKLADRIANMRNSQLNNPKLYNMYLKELPLFLEIAKRGNSYLVHILNNEFISQKIKLKS